MEELDRLLLACFSIDNTERRTAEAALNAWSKTVECVPALLNRSSQSAHVEVRQLASIVLKKKIPGKWRQLSPEVQEATKTTLLESIVKEPVANVRRASADLMAVIARYTVPQGQWPGLLDALLQLSQSPEPVHREVAVLVFSSLTDEIGDKLRPHFQILKDVFLRALQDPVLRISTLALAAVTAFAQYTTEPAEVALLAELVPPMVGVARTCLTNGEEEEACSVFAILLEIIELPVPVLQGMVPAVVGFCLEVALNTQFSLSVRYQAVQPIAWLSVYKPKQLTAVPGLVHSILDCVCSLIREPVPEDHDDDIELSANKFGCQTLDYLAQHLKAKLVYPPITAYAKEMIVSANRNDRASALEALGVIAEGCNDSMRKHVKTLVNEIILPGLRDPEVLVRGAAAICLAQLAEFMPDRLVDRHETIMPAAIALLGDPDNGVKERGCYVVDCLCEALEEHLDKYMDNVMAALLTVMQSGAPVDVQEMALSAITSVAAVAEAAFQRYAPHVFPMLKFFLVQETDTHLKARCVATECLGLVCTALGTDAAEQIAAEYMPYALKGMQLDFVQLREYTFGFFSDLAKALGPKVQPFAADIVALAIKALEQDEESVEKVKGQFEGISSDDDEEFGPGGGFNHKVHTGVIDEKCAATHCLGHLAAASGAAFAPHLPNVAPVVRALCDYFGDEALRITAFEAMVNMIKCVFKIFEGRPDAEAADRDRALEDAAKRLLAALDSDDDMEAVAAAVESLGELLKLAGPTRCAPWLPEFFEGIDKLLLGQALCQTIESDDDEDEGEGAHGGKKHGHDEDEDEDSENETLLSTVVEALAIFAKELGPALYAPVLPKHLESLATRHLKPSQPDLNRGTAVGGIAELSKHMGAHMEPFTATLLPAVMRELRSDDGGNRRNAAFCLGVWFEHCPGSVVPQAVKILQSLHSLFSEEEEASTADNAAGCVCRMILRLGDALPLPQVLPVLLSSLPLQEDFDEAEVVVKCLGTVLVEKAPTVPASVPRVLEVLGEMAVTAKVPADVKQQIGQALVAFGQRYAGSGAHAALQSHLPAEVLGAVMGHLSPGA